MKIIDKMGSWVDKLDSKIFGKKDVSYQPCAGKCFTHVLITSLVSGVILAIVQIVTVGQTAQEVVAVLAGLVILYYIIRDIRPAIKSFTGIGKKIGYVFFNMFIAAIAFQLALYAIFLLIILIVIWVVLSVMFPGGKKKYTVHYDDGTSEEVESSRGLMGEERIPTRNGEVDPNDLNR